MVYFYYFGFIYLGYMIFLLFKKTGEPLDISFSTDIVEMGRQANDLSEKNKTQSLFYKVKNPISVIWIGIGIFISDYQFAFISLFVLALAHTFNKLNKDKSNARVIYAIIDISRIVLISFVLYDYFYLQNS